MTKYIYKKIWLRIMCRLIDAIGSIFFSYKRRVKCPDNIKKILVVKMNHIGDILLSTPAVSNLKKTFPDAEIDYLLSIWSEPIIRRNPNIRKIYTFSPFWQRGGEKFNLRKYRALIKDLRLEKYDVAVILEENLLTLLTGLLAKAKYAIGWNTAGLGFFLNRSIGYTMFENKHQIYRDLSVVKSLTRKIEGNPVLEFYLTKESEKKVDRFLDSKKIKGKFSILHCMAGTQSKQWPIENWREIINFLLERNVTPILVGSAEEREKCEELIGGRRALNAAGIFNLEEMGAICKKAEFFIGNDSGPGHIAASQNIPVITIFSSVSDPDRWKPFGSRVYVLQKELKCANCQREYCETKECLRLISVKEVIDLIENEKLV